jgi:transcriptional antiterminator RfaH
LLSDDAFSALMNDTCGQPWYVVLSKPRQESVAEQNLIRQSYDVYLPWLKKLKVRAKKELVPTYVPLFPRYMFCRARDAEHSIAPVRSSYGVTSILRFGMELATVSPQTLLYIRNLELKADRAGYEALTPFKPGVQVRIRDGALEGYEAVVTMSDTQRVQVLLQILGKEHELSFTPGQVVPV